MNIKFWVSGSTGRRLDEFSARRETTAPGFFCCFAWPVWPIRSQRELRHSQARWTRCSLVELMPSSPIQTFSSVNKTAVPEWATSPDWNDQMLWRKLLGLLVAMVPRVFPSWVNAPRRAVRVLVSKRITKAGGLHRQVMQRSAGVAVPSSHYSTQK